MHPLAPLAARLFIIAIIGLAWIVTIAGMIYINDLIAAWHKARHRRRLQRERRAWLAANTRLKAMGFRRVY